jgi:hypothetical protein
VGFRLHEAGLRAISSQRMPTAVRVGARIVAFIFRQARAFVNAHASRGGHVDRREIGCYYLVVRKCVCQCDLCWEASLGCVIPGSLCFSQRRVFSRTTRISLL